MIDWHSHILPGIDDGSQNISQSISLLNMQASQGIDTVIATPHFYANNETVDTFINRRNESFEKLKKSNAVPPIKIVLGAEVKYYMGISKISSLESLKISGSNLLLLEMPLSRWTDFTVRELLSMASKGNLQIVLAHIERYIKFQKKEVWEELLKNDILMQANAGFFNSFLSEKKAVSLLKKGYIHFVGSDCHNLSDRSPKIGKAYDIIQNKLGRRFLSQMNEYGHSMLNL